MASNHYVGVFKLEPSDFTEIVYIIRQVLVENAIHFKAGNKERLNIPKNLVKIKFNNIEHRRNNPRKNKKIFKNVY
ncbi:hypothetical protein NUSPORA_02755 [Nucleospora cyclopteri]